jgi:hypothetical protein
MKRATLPIAWMVVFAACVAPADPPARLAEQRAGDHARASAPSDAVVVARDDARNDADAPAREPSRHDPRAAVRDPVAPANDAIPRAVIEVLDRGTGETTRVRPTAAAGTEQDLAIAIDGTMKVITGSEVLTEARLAPIHGKWHVRVEGVDDDGSRSLSLTLSAIGYDETFEDARMRSATERSLTPLQGLRATVRVAGEGAPDPLDLPLPDRTPTDLRPAVEALLQAIPLLFVAVPDDPLGTGARWTTESTIAFAGLRLRQRAEYRITAVTAEGASIAFTLTHDQPRTPSPVTSRPIEKHDARITGELTLARNRIAPTRVTAAAHVEMHSPIMVAGARTDSTLELDLTLGLGPPR